MDAIKDYARPMVAACVASDEFVAFADQGSTGTKMPRTSWGSMSRYPFPVASELVVEHFGRLTLPLFERIGASIHESRTLAATRDLLLPKLMSGEIRLGEAEAIAEAAE